MAACAHLTSFLFQEADLKLLRYESPLHGIAAFKSLPYSSCTLRNKRVCDVFQCKFQYTCSTSLSVFYTSQSFRCSVRGLICDSYGGLDRYRTNECKARISLVNCHAFIVFSVEQYHARGEGDDPSLAGSVRILAKSLMSVIITVTASSSMLLHRPYP